MYKVINNRRYNTETAKKLGYWESDQDYRGLYHEEEILYRNKAGNYFLYGYGGAGSKYSQQIGANEWSSGESILPLEEDDARKWAEAHLDWTEYPGDGPHPCRSCAKAHGADGKRKVQQKRPDPCRDPGISEIRQAPGTISVPGAFFERILQK